MRNAAYILFLSLAGIGIVTGCSADPATAVEGDYSLEPQSVQINGVIINMGDWPGASVSITGTDESTADISLDSLLLGFDRLTLPCEVSRTDRDKYSFYGEYSGQDRDIELSGNVNKGKMSLSITDICTSEATGRWRTATEQDGLVSLSLSFECPLISEIPLGDTTISLDTAVRMLNTALRASLTTALSPLDYIEMSNTGYVNIYWPDPEHGSLHIYLRRTLTDGLGFPVSPLDIPAGCSVSGSDMTLTLEKTALEPFTDMLLSAAGDMTYDDYTDSGSPLGDLTEEQFDEYKSLVPVIQGVLAMPSTTYGAVTTFKKTK